MKTKRELARELEDAHRVIAAQAEHIRTVEADYRYADNRQRQYRQLMDAAHDRLQLAQAMVRDLLTEGNC